MLQNTNLERDFFEISPSEKSCASINSNVLNRETHYFRIAHSSRLQSAELAASEDEKNKIEKSSREMTDHLEAQIRQLKSQIEQLEKELNDNKINFTALQKQAQDAQKAKGSNEEQLLR